MQCNQFEFVCMYICMYVSMYVCMYIYIPGIPVTLKLRGHGFCGLVPRLLATWYWSDQEAIKRLCICESQNGTGGHTVLVWPGGDRHVKKIVREPKWSRNSPSVIMVESEDGNKETLHQNRVRQRRKSLTDTHFLKVFQTTALLPSLLYLVHST